MKMHSKTKTFSFLIAGLSIMAATANATVLTFDDRALFEAATGATLEGAIPQLPSTTQFTVGNLSFFNVAPSSVNTSRNWSTLIDEPFDLAINGVENFDVTSAVPLFAFGFDFHEPNKTTPPFPQFPDTCNTSPCADSVFELTLLHGGSTVAVHSFTRPKDSLEFVGIWTSNPFDRIEIRETTGTLDNEFFGNFTTGTTPEPTSLALLGLALGAALATVRRRRNG